MVLESKGNPAEAHGIFSLGESPPIPGNREVMMLITYARITLAD